MQNMEQKLAQSLTAETTELIPYLPYLLQDLWALGSGPEDIKELIQKYIKVSPNTKILDLACGKGAISVELAKTFACKIKGIDIISEFIEYAQKKAKEYSVDELCEFTVEDINQSVMYEKGYDIVILSDVGDVLGISVEAILKLKSIVSSGGYILIADAYGKVSSGPDYPLREDWIKLFHDAGTRVIAEKMLDTSELAAINKYNQNKITKRANEMKRKYPDKAEMFEMYIRSQQAECDELEVDLTCVTWLLEVV
jgi:ubiquinone/menaquinone biosynthesis C-methylase UbiE